MSELRLIGPHQVAAMLGERKPGKPRDVCWFFRHRRQLEARGFPKPVPGIKNGYDPRAVEAWLTAQMDPALRAVYDARRRAELATAAPNITLVAGDAELATRAQDLAHRKRGRAA